MDLSKPHTVVVVTSNCRLPWVQGRLGPGIYHFAGDQRKYIRTVYYRKQSKSADIYFIAGDTEEALATIAKLKAVKVDPSYVAPPASISGSPKFVSKADEFKVDVVALMDLGYELSPEREAALQEIADFGQLQEAGETDLGVTEEFRASALDLTLEQYRAFVREAEESMKDDPGNDIPGPLPRENVVFGTPCSGSTPPVFRSLGGEPDRQLTFDEKWGNVPDIGRAADVLRDDLDSEPIVIDDPENKP